MKPQKMNAYATFAEWKRDQSAENQRLIDRLARLVRKVEPSLEPSVKWGQGCWLLNGVPKVYLHAEPDHVQCGFYAGSTLEDPDRLLRGNGKHVRHVKVYPQGAMPRAALAGFVRQVIGRRRVEGSQARGQGKLK